MIRMRWSGATHIRIEEIMSGILQSPSHFSYRIMLQFQVVEEDLPMRFSVLHKSDRLVDAGHAQPSLWAPPSFTVCAHAT